MPKNNLLSHYEFQFSNPGWHQCPVSKVLGGKTTLDHFTLMCEVILSGNTHTLLTSAASASTLGFHNRPYLGQDLKPTPCEWKKISVCTGLDREKYSTLHTCGTKILPCEEDSMIMVLSMIGVAALLRVGPPTHLLQAAWRVATLNQAYGLYRGKDQRNRHFTILQKTSCK